MCITVLLIPLVVLKITPKIRTFRTGIEEADKRADELLAEANKQMLPLNRLFTDRDALSIIESTIPLIAFDHCFSVKQEADMKINYDFSEYNEEEQSTLDVLAGNYNDNPFLFENKVIHTMGTETYHGYKTIEWKESYRDSNGKLRTRTRTQTLHATVTKPKPFYRTQVVLNYCSQGGPDLIFSRNAAHHEQKSEKEIEKLVKRGEKKLKKMNDQAISNNSEFMSMSNSEFEILYLLARRPGWVYTRGQIVNEVKGDDYPVTERAVDVQMVSLRRKLGVHADLIETVRGVGYRFTQD